MALGAERRDVLKMVLGRGFMASAAGVGIGLAGAVVVMRLMSSLLYGVRPFDPLTFAFVAIGLVAIALLASYVPARRATNVDPMVALRYE